MRLILNKSYLHLTSHQKICNGCNVWAQTERHGVDRVPPLAVMWCLTLFPRQSSPKTGLAVWHCWMTWSNSWHWLYITYKNGTYWQCRANQYYYCRGLEIQVLKSEYNVCAKCHIWTCIMISIECLIHKCRIPSCHTFCSTFVKRKQR